MEPEPLFCEIPKNEVCPAHRLAYYFWDNPSAPETVICVHGLTRNGRDFDYLANQLSKKYNVICPDMPGRGKSDYLQNPQLYNTATYIADILYLLAARNIKSVRWVGTSMGGIIGMAMANTVPGFITSLVLNDIGMLIPSSGLARIMRYAGVNIVFNSRAEAEAALRANCKPFGIKEEAHWQHIFNFGIVEENGSFRLNYDVNIMSNFGAPEKLEDANMWGFLEGVSKLPVLLIRGADSDIVSRETAAEMQAKIPLFQLLEIPDTGHAPALMESSQIAYVKNWLAVN